MAVASEELFSLCSQSSAFEASAPISHMANDWDGEKEEAWSRYNARKERKAKAKEKMLKVKSYFDTDPSTEPSLGPLGAEARRMFRQAYSSWSSPCMIDVQARRRSGEEDESTNMSLTSPALSSFSPIRSSAVGIGAPSSAFSHRRLLQVSDHESDDNDFQRLQERREWRI
mmetsp:Transcript_19851/g.45912  ORF Transcript_19851/g.45912 Transcript_19851/m.45912 type:complete len:171 (-) Transcript_19851:180-692(-)